MAEALLIVGIAATAGHVGCDLLRFREHIQHKRDWFTVASLVCFVAHVVLTGEVTKWVT